MQVVVFLNGIVIVVIAVAFAPALLKAAPEHNHQLRLAVTVKTGEVMHSLAVVVAVLFPRATARQQMSRSVITPTSSGFSLERITGISPQSWSTIKRATSSSFAVGRQQAGLFVITSLMCIGMCLLWTSIIARRQQHTVAVRGFAVTRIRCRLERLTGGN